METTYFGSVAGEVGSQITHNATQGLMAGEAASVQLGSLAPAGAEEVSVHATVMFARQADEIVALNHEAQQELRRAGAALCEAARMLAEVDAAEAGKLIVAGLR